MNVIFTNFALLDTHKGVLESGYEILIEGNRITRVTKGKIDSAGVDKIDLGGRTLMPGLIDCHVHINRWILPEHPVVLPSYMTARAGKTLEELLMCGFTTVRDAGGADAGHRKAVEDGLFIGPRLFVSGRAISQTGGHGDRRSVADMAPQLASVYAEPGLGRIADGVPEVLKAVRDEIRMGCDQVKIMAGGGVASEADPVDHIQYSMEELNAICGEARRANKYVMAHIFADEGIRNCMEAGVRTIEHGWFIKEDTAKLMAEKGVFLSPNLVTVRIIVNEGKKLGYSDVKIEKGKEILEATSRAFQIAQRAGVKICYASDLSRQPHRGCEEFLVRDEFMTPAESIQSATIIGAEVLQREGQLGVISEGALADIIAVDGNPLEDISLLARQGKHISLIMKDGAIYKNRLAA